MPPIKILLLIWMLCTAWTFAMVNYANGHESHGFTHMGPKGSGPIIGQRYCPGSLTQMWYHDHNEDGKVDGCTLVIFAHETIHVQPVGMTNGTCECPQ